MKTLIIPALLILASSAFAREGVMKQRIKFDHEVAMRGGDVEGNGGDRCARDFARMGRIVYDSLKDNSYSRNINMLRLNEAINKSSVSIVKGELYDTQGGSVPAANDGVSKIFLSKSGWCEQAQYKREAAIVLHEYLGIAMPGQDQQYQISGSLYARVGLANDNFHTYLQTGTDFATEQLRMNFRTDISPTSMTLETASIKDYFGVISINDSDRFQKRAKIFCDKGTERIQLSSLYAVYDSKRSPKWFYQETPLQTYKFTSSQQCYRLLRKASLSENATHIEVGLDTLTVVNFF